MTKIFSPFRQRAAWSCAILLVAGILPAFAGQAAAQSCSQPSFITNRSFPSGSNNRGAAVADFNNDGKLDIVTINATSPTYQAGVMFGNGDGTFGNPIMTNIEQNASFVVVGDFNSDGKQDLAYTVLGARAVAIQRGNGNGTFALPDIFFVAHANPSDLIAKDFNNDGKLDVAVGNGVPTSGDTVQKMSVLFGDGLGGLGAATNYNGHDITHGSLFSVAAADDDGDGDIDIVASCSGHGVLLRFANNGNGTFAPESVIPLANPPVSDLLVTFGNFNQDNISDLVTAGAGGASYHLPLAIFRLSGSPATVQRQYARESGMNTGGLQSLIMADLDGDGREDDLALARTTSKGIIVMLNASEPNGDITNYFAGNAPSKVMAGDFNNDGRIDLAASQGGGSQVWILLNAGNGKFVAPLRPTNQGASNGQGGTNTDIKVGNFNGDAYPDIVMASACDGCGLQTFNGLNSGGFENMSIVTPPRIVDSNGVAVGDLNNDGKEDIVSTPSIGVAPYLGNGDGTFTFVNGTFGGAGYIGVVLGDYNADNRRDAVVADYQNDRIGYFRGNGQGAFNSVVFFNVGDQPWGVVTQDFNGDGKLDIATANQNSNNVSVLLGVGDGTFSAATNFNVGTAPQWLALGDFNGDSKTDIAVTNLNSNNVSILLGNGIGGFSGATNFPANATPSQLTSGDLNGDGFLDIAVVGYQNQTVSILTGNGNGTFNAPITIADFFNLPVAIKAMDVNADNRLDLVVTNQNAASITVLINNCTAAPAATVQLTATTYSILEGAARALVTVTRTGNTSNAAAVDLTTVDGTASQRTDYTYVNATLNFAAGDTTKDVVIPITNDAYQEPDETVTLALSNPTGGAGLGATPTATLTILNDDNGTPTTNPINANPFFANQNYNDFLAREPDAAGLAYWTGELNAACGVDPACLSRRIGVSAAFFVELEYQESGAYVYRLYRVAFGNNQPFPNPDTNPPGGSVTASQIPAYAKYQPDRSRVVGGATLAAGKLDFANQFAARPEFTARYPVSQTPAQFVDAVLATVNTASGVTFSATERQNFITGVTNNGRSEFLRDVGDNTALRQAEYNRAFVLTQYFGYLRRDPDMAGYNFWLGVINQQPNNFRGMVCAFVTSGEYQQRFSSVVTRGNDLCNGMP